jgi:hypothetical protein
MTTVHLTAYDAESRTPQARPLRLSQPGDRTQVLLQRIPGAEAMLLPITITADGCSPQHYMAEISLGEDSELVVELRLGAGDRIDVLCPGRSTHFLPAKTPDGSDLVVPPVHPQLTSAALDIALVVDGTTQRFDMEWLQTAGSEGRSGFRRLLQSGQPWTQIQQQLLALVDGLAQRHPARVRFTTFAFADHGIDEILADDLRPDYLLRPPLGEHALRPYQPAQARAALSHLQSSAGGDFVDALAEALDAAAGLSWMPDARKILLVLGDSPGHSILDPAPWGADVTARAIEVEAALEALHHKEVEVISVYHRLPDDCGIFDEQGSIENRLRDYSWRQYRRLATRPELALTVDELDPVRLVEGALHLGGPVARGCTWGLWPALRTA